MTFRACDWISEYAKLNLGLHFSFLYSRSAFHVLVGQQTVQFLSQVPRRLLCKPAVKRNEHSGVMYIIISVTGRNTTKHKTAHLKLSTQKKWRDLFCNEYNNRCPIFRKIFNKKPICNEFGSIDSSCSGSSAARSGREPH